MLISLRHYASEQQVIDNRGVLPVSINFGYFASIKKFT